MSKFTPGPWVADETTVKAGRDTIAAVYDPNDTCHRTNVGLANTCLIASAPDMYEALKAVESLYIDSSFGFGGQAVAAIGIISAAISKAEGNNAGTI